MIRLAGTRVIVRELASDDAETVVGWRHDPEIASQMFAPPPASIDDHRRWHETMRAAGDRQEFTILQIDGKTERRVGTIGLSGISVRHRRAEYGILIGDRAARGAGIAYEASRLILDHAFGELGLGRVFLHVFADNAAGLRLYGRLGFVHEGTLRRHAVRNDVATDVLVMGLLVDDYRGSVGR